MSKIALGISSLKPFDAIDQESVTEFSCTGMFMSGFYSL